MRACVLRKRSAIGTGIAFRKKTHCHCSIAPPRTAGTLVTALLTGQLLANRAGKGKVVAYALKLEQLQAL